MVAGAQVKGIWVRTEGDKGCRRSGVSARRPCGERPGVRGRAECKPGAGVGLIIGLLTCYTYWIWASTRPAMGRQACWDLVHFGIGHLGLAHKDKKINKNTYVNRTHMR